MQQKINLTQVICLWMGKTYTAKTPPSDFKVTTLENLLLSKQTVTSKGIPVPYTNLQLNPYPNIQLDLFYSNNLSFQCTIPGTWLTNCANSSTQLDHQPEKDVSCKVLLFITRWRSWSSWSQNLKVYKTQQLLQEKEELGQTRFLVTLFFTLVELSSCATCVTFYSSQNNPYICLGLWEKKKTQTYIHRLDENQLEKLNFINLDR